MTQQRGRLDIRLPGWAVDMGEGAAPMPDDQQRMALVVAAARRNAEIGEGPFAAAVFETESGRLISLGVNLVQSLKLSILHAEMVALSFAQARLQTFDLGAGGLPQHELVTSAEPCAMCLGAVPWSGVSRLVIGARTADVEAAGFDEGAKPENWIAEMEKRGVAVTRDVQREEAAAAITEYAKRGGLIYNPAQR